MMEVVIPGYKPPEVMFYGQCTHCASVVKGEEIDLHIDLIEQESQLALASGQVKKQMIRAIGSCPMCKRGVAMMPEEIWWKRNSNKNKDVQPSDDNKDSTIQVP